MLFLTSKSICRRPFHTCTFQVLSYFKDCLLEKHGGTEAAQLKKIMNCYTFSDIAYKLHSDLNEIQQVILTLKARNKNCSIHFIFLLLSFEENKA